MKKYHFLSGIYEKACDAEAMISYYNELQINL